MAGPDFDTEIKQLQATMKTIGQVLDLDGMRAEIADLGEQVAAPDLWDDQDNATRVTGRLSLLQGELDRFTELSGRLDDLELMVELGRDENDAETTARKRGDRARALFTKRGVPLSDVHVGAADPAEAIDEEVAAHPGYAGFIISTLPKENSRWLRMDLPRTVRVKHRLPVHHVVAAREFGLSDVP